MLRLHTADGRPVHPPVPRTRPRHGQLTTPMTGKPDDHVRCACDDCGAHLLGVWDGTGHAAGVCLVCGSVAVTPL